MSALGATKLAAQACVACRPDSPAVTDAQRARLLAALPDWRARQRNGVMTLTRAFEFKDFAAALAFTNAVGALAEAEDHHPEIVTEWGRVTVAWWTHAIGGLHRNDFILAARCDRAFSGG